MIPLKTHKMLWGRSGNMCAFAGCKKELVMHISEADDFSIVGDEAHIVAREESGPRGNSPLPLNERDNYSNLMLLCKMHHKIVDDNPEIYTVETLHEYKKVHESWVKTSLITDPKKTREDELYASYIDEVNKLADIENYKGWTSFMLGQEPRIGSKQYDSLVELIHYISSRIWFHRYPRLENALINLKIILNDLLRVFDKYSVSTEDKELRYTRKFYKIDEWNPKLYQELLDKYEYHNELITDLILELTRAFNYLFDLVREFLIPNFRIEEGVLLVEIGPFMDFSFRTYRTEYQFSERKDLPYQGLEKFMIERETRNVSFGIGSSKDYFPKNYY